jgi:hypothetical protein
MEDVSHKQLSLLLLLLLHQSSTRIALQFRQYSLNG